MKPRARIVAILDDDADRTAAMKDAMQRNLPDVEPVFFDNAPEMIAWLATNLTTISALSLDHDLGPSRDHAGTRFDPGIGRDVVAVLEKLTPACPIIVHSSNGPAAEGMLYALQFAGWAAERVYPFRDLAWIDEDWIDRVMACVLTEPPQSDSSSISAV